MTLIRCSIIRLMGAQPIRSSIVQPPVLRSGHKRTLTNQPKEAPHTYSSAPGSRWLWWVAGSGAVMLLYLWNKSSKNVKTMATRNVQEGRGASQEYVENAEGNEN